MSVLQEGKCVWPWECDWEDCCERDYEPTKKGDQKKKKGPQN